jgi:hypothetical protein
MCHTPTHLKSYHLSLRPCGSCTTTTTDDRLLRNRKSPFYSLHYFSEKGSILLDQLLILLGQLFSWRQAPNPGIGFAEVCVQCCLLQSRTTLFASFSGKRRKLLTSESKYNLESAVYDQLHSRGGTQTPGSVSPRFVYSTVVCKAEQRCLLLFLERKENYDSLLLEFSSWRACVSWIYNEGNSQRSDRGNKKSDNTPLYKRVSGVI